MKKKVGKYYSSNATRCKGIEKLVKHDEMMN